MQPINSLSTLAAALGRAALPQLQAVILSGVTAAGGPVAGALAGALLPELAKALGLPDDSDASAIAQKIDAAPSDAAQKLALLEQSALDFAKLQAAQNQKEAESASLFIAGWRPAFAWCVIGWMNYSFLASVLRWPPLPPDLFNPAWIAFVGMMGLRTAEKWGGVARETLKSVASAAGAVVKRR